MRNSTSMSYTDFGWRFRWMWLLVQLVNLLGRLGTWQPCLSSWDASDQYVTCFSKFKKNPRRLGLQEAQECKGNRSIACILGRIDTYTWYGTSCKRHFKMYCWWSIFVVWWGVLTTILRWLWRKHWLMTTPPIDVYACVCVNMPEH